MQKKGSVAVALLMAIGIFTVSGCNIAYENENKNLTENSDQIHNEPSVTTEPYIPPVVVEMNNEDVHKGRLILVNKDYEYIDGSNPNIVNIAQMKNESYSVNTNDMTLDAEMIQHINDMLKDFSEQTGITDVLANSGYRSYDQQQELYNAHLEATGQGTSLLVAPPGRSEHHTGYAMDFAINDGQTYPALKNEGQYSWIYENAARYGMILRYTEKNQDFTGYSPESWHFRYIGTPQAAVVNRMGISYEEFINFIRDFSYDEPLEYKYSDSEFYKIYFVPVDSEKNVTEIPISYEAFSSDIENSYSISGNNIDGFIVTLKTDKLPDDYNEMLFDMFKTPEQSVSDYESPTEPDQQNQDNTDEANAE